MVLKDDLDEGAIGEVKDIGLHGECTWNTLRVILSAVVLENLLRDSVILGELDWGLWFHVRDAVEPVTKLTAVPADGVNELNGAGDVDLSIVVRALWVRPGSTGG